MTQAIQLCLVTAVLAVIALPGCGKPPPPCPAAVGGFVYSYGIKPQFFDLRTGTSVDLGLDWETVGALVFGASLHGSQDFPWSPLAHWEPCEGGGYRLLMRVHEGASETQLYPPLSHSQTTTTACAVFCSPGLDPQVFFLDPDTLVFRPRKGAYTLLDLPTGATIQLDTGPLRLLTWVGSRRAFLAIDMTDDRSKAWWVYPETPVRRVPAEMYLPTFAVDWAPELNALITSEPVGFSIYMDGFENYVTRLRFLDGRAQCTLFEGHPHWVVWTGDWKPPNEDSMLRFDMEYLISIQRRIHRWMIRSGREAP